MHDKMTKGRCCRSGHCRPSWSSVDLLSLSLSLSFDLPHVERTFSHLLGLSVSRTSLSNRFSLGTLCEVGVGGAVWSWIYRSDVAGQANRTTALWFAG